MACGLRILGHITRMHIWSLKLQVVGAEKKFIYCFKKMGNIKRDFKR